MQGVTQYFTTFFLSTKEKRIFHIYSYPSQPLILEEGEVRLRELRFCYPSGQKEVKENKLLFEHIRNSSNSLENRSSKGLITATEEV